jgi:hypothetical protein
MLKGTPQLRKHPVYRLILIKSQVFCVVDRYVENSIFAEQKTSTILLPSILSKFLLQILRFF